ncbi:hypothetical protein SLS62_011050 [Diatrype stigma]|uniref:Mid2 domain-containing protein n=1 Tax=Diatrype stigma TaxID=117547 RepID=A0AAN9UE80_9PEZI
MFKFIAKFALLGNATASLSIDGDFDALQAFQNLTDQVGGQIENITDTTWDWVQDAVGDVVDNLADGIDSSDFNLPPLDLDFNVQYPDIPECHLQFQFDGLELYLMLNTALSGGADYQLPLYSSNTLYGLSLDKDTFIGVIFSVDLILSLNADINFTSGIHIKIDDGAAIDLSLFGNSVSSITYNGGQFEFLPVTVLSASGELKAVLRLGIYAGVAVKEDLFNFPGTNVSAGLQAGVYADIASFSTNFTAEPDAKGDDECVVQMQQSYEFGLGAAAGASVGIGALTWGPSPETQTPIFYTTIADACATQGTTTTTTVVTPSIGLSSIAASPLTARASDGEELETTTLSEKVTYTGVVCQSPGLINCPASLQRTTKVVSTKTLITAVPSGSTAAFPVSTGSVVTSPVPFGTNTKSVLATTGSPASYIPPKETETDGSEGPGEPGESGTYPLGTVGGVDNRIIIGVSVGVGVPVIAAVIAAWWLYVFPIPISHNKHQASSRCRNQPFHWRASPAANLPLLRGVLTYEVNSFSSKDRRYTPTAADEPTWTALPQIYPTGGLGTPEQKVTVVTTVRNG